MRFVYFVLCTFWAAYGVHKFDLIDEDTFYLYDIYIILLPCNVRLVFVKDLSHRI